MKNIRSHVRVCAIGVCLLAIPIYIAARSGGPPSGVTGGFGEGNCTQCHRTNPLNTGTGSIVITGPATYLPGTTYPIRVTVANPNPESQRWGFELSTRNQSGQQAGRLLPGGDGYTQLLPELNGIQYISHTEVGTRFGTPAGVNFDFLWQSPASADGALQFHAAGNTANGSTNNTGDFIYTTSFSPSPRTAPIPVPVLPANGVVNGASFAPGTVAVAPGSIVAVFGSNLSDGGTLLSSAFDANGRQVTGLLGARATVGGVAAPMFYTTGGQLGIQIPTEVSGTSTTIQISVGGETSATRTIALEPAAPGIFTTNSQGSGQGVIVLATGGGIAAAVGSISGVTSRPARPGEDITIFATGLGQTNPVVPTGARPTTLTRTVATPTVMIDGMAADVSFSGLSDCCVGLNQINVRVPANTRTGNTIPVVLTISGKQSNSVTIAVGN
ncbi:MAG: hypothetical protein EXQ56_03755 [Acidobacteria bacterium]|nr:hypothetical protein [Acidobacteriota bacterium]